MYLEGSYETQYPDSVIPTGTIWSFWDGNPPELVLRCIESIRLQNPGRPLIVVSKDTLPLFLSSEDYPMFHGRRGGPDDFSCPQYLADWVRLMLLEKYGGIWLDASIICTNAVESWYTSSQTSGNSKTNKITMFPMHANPNVHGNWAMAVDKPGHPLLRAWRHELCRVLNEAGPRQVPLVYCKQAFVDHPNLVALWNNPAPPPLPYLWVYLALQVVLQKHPALHSTVHLLPSVDGPMYRRYKLNIQQGIVDNLDLSAATAHDLANLPLRLEQHDRYFIKLVGKDRDPCEAVLKTGMFQKHSPLDYLSCIAPRPIDYGTNLQTTVLLGRCCYPRNHNSKSSHNNQRFRAVVQAWIVSRHLVELGTTKYVDGTFPIGALVGTIPKIAPARSSVRRRSSLAVAA